MSKYLVKAVYTQEVDVGDVTVSPENLAVSVASSALEDAIDNAIKSVVKDTPIEPIFVWEVQKMNGPKEYADPVERAKMFIKEYSDLCKKYGLIVDFDAKYTERAVVQAAKLPDDIPCQIRELFANLDAKHL